MTDRPFRNPLLAKLDNTSHYAAGSAWEALEFLQRYWHGPRDRTYKTAVQLCHDAIDGWVPAERARRGFKEALRSAGLLIPNPKRVSANELVIVPPSPLRRVQLPASILQ